MTKINGTCDAQSDQDIWGKEHPRDVRLQIYISLTLGVGAFLLFCVWLWRILAEQTCAYKLS